MTHVAIQLPDELSQFVNKSVEAGDFHSTDEFFTSIVSMYKDNVETRLSEADEAKIASLRYDVQHAAAQLDQAGGSEMNWDEFFADRHQAYAERQSAS
jgi:Arc/MetJ-type ribon-helix-helix transcriptional regulator